jgi:hypothetical protein
MRCRTSERRIEMHTTDSASASAGKILRVADFPAGYSAKCECVAKKIATKDCRGLVIHDGNGGEVTTFNGPEFRAAQEDDGSIRVYRLPSLTQDSTDPYRTPIESWGPREAKAALRLANERNNKFWEPQKGTELWKHLNQENK